MVDELHFSQMPTSAGFLFERVFLSIMEVRLGKAELAPVFLGLAGFWLLTLANLVDAFALGDSTPLLQIGWVIVTLALVSFTVLLFIKLARPEPSRQTSEVE